jgi:hypothetical protein
MSSNKLTAEARNENAATLAAALGLDISEAADVLDMTVLVTATASDTPATAFAEDVIALLQRTVTVATECGGDQTPSAEIIIGSATPRSNAKKVFVTVNADHAVISSASSPTPICCEVHGLLRSYVACYICASTLNAALDVQVPYGCPDPLTLTFSELGIDLDALSEPVDIGVAHLAGAGAIGNGFLWAARHIDLRGILHVVDDDYVSSGNLNRQIWFDIDDIGAGKASRLVSKAEPLFKHLRLFAHKSRLQDLPEKSDGAWLKRLIVAVDSRRARRQLQSEFPGEVFDASTTDIREVVIHHNKQPSELACLSCIYEPDEEEESREQHISNHLGVPLDAVRSERITEESAAIISSRFPSLKENELVGIAYDSLYKQLCGTGMLKSDNGKRVLAPFAFVSALAGVLLALEVLRRCSGYGSDRNFNYWRVSAWHPPLSRRRHLRPKQHGCGFCGNKTLIKINDLLWRPISGKSNSAAN